MRSGKKVNAPTLLCGGRTAENSRNPEVTGNTPWPATDGAEPPWMARPAPTPTHRRVQGGLGAGRAAGRGPGDVVPVIEGHSAPAPHQAHRAHHGLATGDACRGEGARWVRARPPTDTAHALWLLLPVSPRLRWASPVLSLPPQAPLPTPSVSLTRSPHTLPRLAHGSFLPVKGPCCELPGAMKLRGTWGVPLTYSCGKGPLAPA